MTHTAESVSPLRQRMLEDMRLRKLSPKTQTDYIRHVKEFTRFLGRSPDTATQECRRAQDAKRDVPVPYMDSSSACKHSVLWR